MIKNYLTIAIRNIRRAKGYTLINVLGLAVGMACCLLIFLFIRDELSYDRYHERSDHIYRLTTGQSARSAVPLGPALQAAFPEVRAFVRFQPPSQGWLIGHRDRRFFEKGFIFADAGVFDLFNWPLVKGDAQTALREPYTVVLTGSMAAKYFGDEDPMGKIITADNGWAEFTVTGILKDIPPNTHFTFGFLASIPTMVIKRGESYTQNWDVLNVYTYLLFAEGTDVEAFERRLPQFLQDHRGTSARGPIWFGAQTSADQALQLQPLSTIYLRSHLNDEIGSTGDIAYIYLFSVVALLILLVACVNFMNMATVRAATRAREIGVRKAIGAQRRQLVGQFLGESMLMTTLALGLALVAVHYALPGFNALTGKQVGWHSLTAYSWGMLLAGFPLLVGMLAGGYPALFLSAFRPVDVLKGRLTVGLTAPRLRKLLVVFQFAVSIMLIVATLIVAEQLRYMQSKPLDFDREQLLVVPVIDAQDKDWEPFKQELLQHPDILSVSTTREVPYKIRIEPKAYTPEGAVAGRTVDINTILADHDVVATFGLELADGRSFSRSFSTDAGGSLLLNEAAARLLDWDDPIGKRLNGETVSGTVIGVVKDFHYEYLHQPIRPLAIACFPWWINHLSLRIRPGNVAQLMTFVEERWHAFHPGWPFEYGFLDQDFEHSYGLETRIGRMARAFTVLAIVLSCVGLLALASFMATARTKEIGVRKVMGASIGNILLLLGREFVGLVGLAMLIAWPVAYIVMARWLDGFAYRIEIGTGPFLMAGIAALVITLLTVGYHTLKAARTNPVDALRYE